MAKLKPDLQEIYNRGDKIDGKGSGQLKEKNTAFFEPGTNMQVVSSPGKRR